MNRNIKLALAFCLLGLSLQADIIRAQETTKEINRRPAVAGSFYPGTKSSLESNLEELFNRSSPKNLEGSIRCLIVPHAGYDYSGIVAASGYGSIPEDAVYQNIFIIGSSHREYFEGASVYSVGNYLTPLGEVQVNRSIALDLIKNNRSIRYNPAAHDREHSIEVQLPFLQVHLKKLPPIVPIIMGSSSVSSARDLAAALMPYFTPENLFIISSDFSHYPGYQDAVRVDRTTADGILTNDPKQFYSILRKNSTSNVENLATPCCGWSSVLTLLYMTEQDEAIRFTPIIYRNSGDAPIGDRNRVVGYWAIAGHEKDEKDQAFVLDEKDRRTLLEISRETLETYLVTRQLPELDAAELPADLQKKAGAFVSLYKHGQLRGCIGSFLPDDPLYRVVQDMSVASATRDTRFYPVLPGELEDINIEISVLTPLQKISSIEEFQLGKQGIYMKKDGRSGTYLPQVAEQTGWDKEEFLGHCARDKAHIGWDGWKDADLYVYEAIVFGEEHDP